MKTRRDFLKFSLGAAAAGIVAPSAAFAASDKKEALPSGLIYTKANPGRWAKKVSSHLPIVEVKDRKVTITTDHPMSEKHYIVRHTLVAKNGKVLGEKTFYPTDKNAVSVFEVPEGYTSLYATSFCNLHDFWAGRLNLRWRRKKLIIPRSGIFTGSNFYRRPGFLPGDQLRLVYGTLYLAILTGLPDFLRVHLYCFFGFCICLVFIGYFTVFYSPQRASYARFRGIDLL
ncbi:MAG: twin-arginine translocation signal domain-containing protein [Deltaproteobacteria bacterium]|nr:twin-arginine translocation signal domain-containing protein [Deltaproteobacteria bacterium]